MNFAVSWKHKANIMQINPILIAFIKSVNPSRKEIPKQTQIQKQTNKYTKT